MLASAILCLSLGLPCLALGVHLSRTPREAKKLKGRRPPSPLGFIIFGAVHTLVGVALMIVHFMR